MFMLANNRDRSNRDGNREGRMNYEMQNGYGNMEMNRMEIRDNPEMRGYDRDRRGRFTGEMEMNRTYEYGPRSGAYGENRYEPRSEDMEGRFRNYRGQEHGNMEMTAGRWMPPYSGEEANGGDDMRMIGFDRPENNEMRMGGSDASMPRYREMDHMQGKAPQMGKGESKSMPEFSPAMAEQWTSHMKNTDGSKGPHWSMEQARQIIAQKKLKCDAYTFWAVLNAMYSDYGKTIQKHGVHTQDFYVDLATDWLKDEDAVDDKAAAYFTYVVKH